MLVSPVISERLRSDCACVGFDQLPGWDNDEVCDAYGAFRRSAIYALEKPYRKGRLGTDTSNWYPARQAAVETKYVSEREARSFFEAHFSVFRINGFGRLTGFYEPVHNARLKQDKDFSVPLLARPPDLVKRGKVDADWCSPYEYGRLTDNRVVEYDDRQAIEAGDIDAPVLAYLTNAVDVFFIHVQGCALLELASGVRMRVSFDGKTGHPFTGIGKILVERGEIEPAQVSMVAIRNWLGKHKEQSRLLMWQNRSYIFFKETELGNLNLGPFAAAKVQLTAGRSLAVDRHEHSFGTPFFVDSQTTGSAISRLVIAQDTGSAIVGAARGDMFVGTGAQSGEVAGRLNQEAVFYIFLPKRADE